jgi:hypothetical protein
VHTVHVLTVSTGLPIPLQDALLTRTEMTLHEHGASRVWVDPAQPGTTVLAEFPATATRLAPREATGLAAGGPPPRSEHAPA